MQSFVVEFFLTFFLMFVVMRASTGSKEKGIHAAVIIGAMVLVEAMFAGPVSGASMNPARSFGPAIASGHLEYLWVYIVAPVVGAAAAVPVSNFFRVTNDVA
jgi:aquaporin Z